MRSERRAAWAAAAASQDGRSMPLRVDFRYRIGWKIYIGLVGKTTLNPAARMRPPEFMAVITGVSEYAHRVEDGVYAIPIRALTT